MLSSWQSWLNRKIKVSQNFCIWTWFNVVKPICTPLFPHPDPNFHSLPSAQRRAVHCWANSFRSNQRLRFTVCVTNRLRNVLEVLARDSCSVSFFPARLCSHFTWRSPSNRKVILNHVTPACHNKQSINLLSVYLQFAILTNINMAKH